MSNFWKSSLDIWCLVVIIFGGILAATTFEGSDIFTKEFLMLIKPGTPVAFDDAQRFAFGLMGVITMGWGLTLFYFFRAAHVSHMGYKMYRQAFLILLIWNLIDGYISYATGYRFNILSNLTLSLGMIISLYMSGMLRD